MTVICVFLPSVSFGTQNTKPFPERELMVTLGKDLVKVDRKARSIPDLTSIIPASSSFVTED